MQRCLNPVSTSPFSVVLTFSRIFQPPGQDQQNGKHRVDYQPCSSRLASRIHPPFHISINSLELYLSPECVVNFLSNLYIPPCVGNIFKFMVFTFVENALNLGIFTHVPHSPAKTFPEFLSENIKVIWNIRLFIFCMICNFFK